MTADATPISTTLRRTAYTLDGGSEDLRRLLDIAQVSEDMTRRGLARTGLARGARALDCGCGPLGALPILAEIVGPEGHVVGADSNAEAIDRAGTTLAALGVDGVHLLTADVNDLDVDAVGGPVDVIYTRCFLMHQRQPAATISRLASLLRPGGWLACHEPLPTPRPWSHPGNEALAAAWDVLHTVVRSSDVGDDAVAGLPDTLSSAGFNLAHVGTASTLMPVKLGFELHAQTLDAVRSRAEALDADLGREVVALADALRAAARDDTYRWVSTPVYLDVAAQRA